MKLSERLVQASWRVRLVPIHWWVELGLVPVVGRAVLGGVFSGQLYGQGEKAMAPHSSTLAWQIPWMEEPGRLQSMGSLRVGHDWSDLAAGSMVRKTLGSLSAKGGAVFPPCWLVDPGWPSTRAFRLSCGARFWWKNGGLQEGSCQWVLPRTTIISVFVPTASHRHPAFAGDSPIWAGRSGLGSYEVTAFPLGWCMCPPRVEFLFPPVLWNSCDQTPLAFKGRFCGTSSSCCQTPGLGSLIWGSELSLLWENFCDTSFQFVGHSLGRYGIWFYREYAPHTALLWPPWM